MVEIETSFARDGKMREFSARTFFKLLKTKDR